MSSLWIQITQHGHTYYIPYQNEIKNNFNFISVRIICKSFGSLKMSYTYVIIYKFQVSVAAMLQVIVLLILF